MDFEKIRVSFLSQLIEINSEWKLPYLDFNKLKTLADNDTAKDFSIILSENFSSKKPTEELLENRYFIAFVSGLALSNSKIEINTRKEIALEIIKNSEKFFRDKGYNKGNDDDPEKSYEFYTNDDLVKWVFLCGLDAVIFLLENTDFRTEVFYGIANPSKLLIELGVVIRRVLAITDAVHDNSVQKIYEDTTLAESVSPLIAALRNGRIEFKHMETLFNKGKFDIEIDLDLTLSALIAVACTGEGVASVKSLDLTAKLMGRNAHAFTVLSGLSPIPHELNYLLYTLCKTLSFETFRENLQNYLLNILEEREKDYISTNITLLSIAVGLMERKNIEVKEDVIEFLLFLQNQEKLDSSCLAGAYIAREYGFENLANEFKINFTEKERKYFSGQENLSDLKKELASIYKRPVWFAKKVTSDYNKTLERFSGISSGEFKGSSAPRFEIIHEDNNMSVLEYSIIPSELTIEHLNKNYRGKELVSELENLLSKHPFNFEIGNYLAELYVQSGKGKEAMAVLKRSYERLEKILSEEVDNSAIIIDGNLNSNFHPLKLLASYGINLINSNNASGIKVLNKLLSIEPGDRFGIKSRLLEFYIKKKNFSALEEFIEKHGSSKSLEFVMAGSLLKLRRQKKDEAEIEMLNALNINPNVIDALLGKPIQSEFHPGSASVPLVQKGSKDEALEFAERYRKYWKQISGVDYWLKHVKKVFNELI